MSDLRERFKHFKPTSVEDNMDYVDGLSDETLDEDVESLTKLSQSLNVKSDNNVDVDTKNNVDVKNEVNANTTFGKSIDTKSPNQKDFKTQRKDNSTVVSNKSSGKSRDFIQKTTSKKQVPKSSTDMNDTCTLTRFPKHLMDFIRTLVPGANSNSEAVVSWIYANMDTNERTAVAPQLNDRIKELAQHIPQYDVVDIVQSMNKSHLSALDEILARIKALEIYGAVSYTDQFLYGGLTRESDGVLDLTKQKNVNALIDVLPKIREYADTLDKNERAKVYRTNANNNMK